NTGHTIPEETEDVQNIDREMVARGLKDGSEGDSYNDSNSISEGYDTTMTLDLDDEAEKSVGKIGSPSVSSNNFNLDSFDTKKVKESGNKGNDSLEDIQQLESAYKGIDDLHPGYEDYGHNIVSELGKNSLEHLDAEIEDLMLYSNDVAPHALLVSPERWSSGRGLYSCKYRWLRLQIIRAVPDRDWGLLIALFGGTHPGDHWFPRMTLNPDCVGTRNPQCSNTQLPKRLVRRRLLHRPRPRSGFAHGSPISSKSSSGSRRITPLTARLSLPPPPPSWVPRKIPKTPPQGKHLCLLRATK
ncbi:hypothetical protein B296_00011859, partial [Ensete ventricosum]